MPPDKQAKSLLTPPSDLGALAETSVDLALLVAENPATPVDVLKKLAKHQSSEVRRRVATHGSLTADLQEMLASDPDVEVRVSLVENRPPYDRDSETFLAHVPRAPSVLLRLSQDAAEKVRKAVAGKQDLPPEVERGLAADKSAKVRLWFLQTRWMLDSEILQTLEDDRSAKVRQAAAKRQVFDMRRESS